MPVPGVKRQSKQSIVAQLTSSYPVATGAARAHADAPDPAAPAMCACSLVPLGIRCHGHHRGATNPPAVIVSGRGSVLATGSGAALHAVGPSPRL